MKKLMSWACAAVCAASLAAEAPTPGGTWKIVYSSAEGPQGRALEVLTERIGFHPFCEAELFWNSDDPWEKILMRARMRALPER